MPASEDRNKSSGQLSQTGRSESSSSRHAASPSSSSTQSIHGISSTHAKVVTVKIMPAPGSMTSGLAVSETHVEGEGEVQI